LMHFVGYKAAAAKLKAHQTSDEPRRLPWVDGETSMPAASRADQPAPSSET
jgi:hypothetical protein